MKKKYRVDFYDTFDGWITSGISDPQNEYESLEKAVEECKVKQEKFGFSSMGEHYGVIDSISNKEVFCGKDWLSGR